MPDSLSPAAGRPPSRDPFSAQEAMLSWVRDIAPYGILITDAQLVIRDWNQWLVTHSGWSADDVIGRRLVDVFPDLVERRLDEYFRRAAQGEVVVLSTALHKYLLPFAPMGAAYNTEYMLQTARIAPLPASGGIVGTISIIEDVTQRESQAAILRRQQEHDRLLSESLGWLLRSRDPTALIGEIFTRITGPLKLDTYCHFLLSPGGTELRLQAASGLAPESRKALAVVPVDAAVCGDAVRRRAPVVATAVQQDATSRTELLRRIGLRCYAAFPLLIEDRVLGTISFGSYARDALAPEEIEFLAKFSQFFVIAVDRAQREAILHDAQERLTLHAGELEQKITERTHKLNETIVQLESFSYTIAHDLRAPIRALNGYTDILLGDFGGAMPEEAHALVRRLQHATGRLDALTRDLLKFSRIVRQDVVLAPVDVDELVGEIVSHSQPLQGPTLVVRGKLGRVQAQRTMLQQCFSNLFDNALKFAAPDRPLEIVVRSQLGQAVPATGRDPSGPESTAPARLRVWIEDNGIGIPAEAHRKIWDIFERIPGARKVEGTGIGLAIVARAMQQMGGACGVESVPGEGSRFWLELNAAS